MLKQLQIDYALMAVELQQLRNDILHTLEGLENERKNEG